MGSDSSDDSHPAQICIMTLTLTCFIPPQPCPAHLTAAIRVTPQLRVPARCGSAAPSVSGPAHAEGRRRSGAGDREGPNGAAAVSIAAYTAWTMLRGHGGTVMGGDCIYPGRARPFDDFRGLWRGAMVGEASMHDTCVTDKGDDYGMGMLDMWDEGEVGYNFERDMAGGILPIVGAGPRHVDDQADRRNEDRCALRGGR